MRKRSKKRRSKGGLSVGAFDLHSAVGLWPVLSARASHRSHSLATSFRGSQKCSDWIDSVCLPLPAAYEEKPSDSKILKDKMRCEQTPLRL